MATVERVLLASPERVFAILADGWTYSNWVVGTSHMRAVDSNWPAPGSRLHHASGVWPVVVRDHTEVTEVTAGSRLVLAAQARPFGNARIVLDIEATVNGGCRVRMCEAPSSGPGKWFHNPVAEALLARRNVESLDRLAAIAENRDAPDD